MRLEINGTEADLGANIIAITRQVIDLDNLSLRNIDITNRLRLPKSNVNQQIFNSADRVETNNDGLDLIYQSKIIDQFFIFNGIGTLNETNLRYNFQLIEASKNLFKSLNDKINKLSYDDQDFTFNDANYDILKVIDDDSIWVWPIVAMHEDTVESKTRFTSGDAGLKWSRPMLNFKKILTDLIENQGWTINIDTDIIDRLAISANAQRFYVTSYQKTFNASYTLSGSQDLTGYNTNDFEFGVTTLFASFSIGNTPTAFKLRGPVIADTDVIFQVVATSTPSNKIITKEFKILEGQTDVDFTTSEFKPSDSDTGITIKVRLSGTGDFEFTDTLFYSIIEEQQLGNLSSNNLIGYRVKAFDNMPDKTQMDIFRTALIITNSIIEPNSFKKEINLKSLKFISKLKSKDWSSKFEGTEGTYSIKNTISGYAQKNNLIYDNDESVAVDLGLDFFEIDNEISQDETDVLKIEFGASNEVEIENQSKTIAHLLCYDDTERINELNDRIVYLFDDTTPATYTMGRFIELDWRTLKETYYKTWFNSFNRLRIIEGYANLNKSDVINHDFIDLVYIDKFKSTFFVLIMDDYIAGELTKIKLLKIA